MKAKILNPAASRLCLGTVQFGLAYGLANQKGRMSLADAGEILRLAHSANIGFLDTAIAYGEAEAVLGQLGASDFAITSKLPPFPQDQEPSTWMRQEIAQALQRLNCEKLHACLLHRASDLLGPQGGSLYQSLRQLRDDGLVQNIGISIYHPSELDGLPQDMQFNAVQFPYNVLDREIAHSGWLDRLKDRGIETQARSVFLQGLLLMAPEKRPAYFQPWQNLLQAWDEFLKAHGLCALTAAMGHVLADARVDRLVIGVDNAAHLQQIIEAMPDQPVFLPETLRSQDQALIHPGHWKLT